MSNTFRNLPLKFYLSWFHILVPIFFLMSLDLINYIHIFTLRLYIIASALTLITSTLI